jgi:hypothetical protein
MRSCKVLLIWLDAILFLCARPQRHPDEPQESICGAKPTRRETCTRFVIAFPGCSSPQRWLQQRGFAADAKFVLISHARIGLVVEHDQERHETGQRRLQRESDYATRPAGSTDMARLVEQAAAATTTA